MVNKVQKLFSLDLDVVLELEKQFKKGDQSSWVNEMLKLELAKRFEEMGHSAYIEPE